jgi:hypothetical protein
MVLGYIHRDDLAWPVSILLEGVSLALYGTKD